MDISEELDSIGEIKSILKGFPRKLGVPILKEKYIPTSKYRKIRMERLEKLKPYLLKIRNEISAYIDSFDTKYFETIDKRYNFVFERYIEIKNKLEENEEKMELIGHLECYDKYDMYVPPKIKYTVDETIDVIKTIHKLQIRDYSSSFKKIFPKVINLEPIEINENELKVFQRIETFLGLSQDM